MPHLAFATAIAGWCAWFCFDAWHAQRDVENLILIVPASCAALLLYAVVAAGCLREIAAPDLAASDFAASNRAAAARPPLEDGLGGKIMGTMAMLAAYAVAGPMIGFDVASFAYLLAMLLFLGERRIIVLLLVPALFCVIVIYCFGTLLATPLPVLVFGGDAS